ncbi:MAG: DUF3087 domain-containing protein, partial [Alkalimonas sp.]|nr:DUF3087 domain-containing protein [Alkalimonas sp.]
QRLRVIMIVSVLALLIISFASSTMLIQLFSEPNSGNFYYNLAGVVLGCLVVGFTLKKLKYRSPYFAEAAYIWDLKHELNLIQRKLKAIQAAAAKNDQAALTILSFSYAGSRLIWQLDDNTLMMSELNQADNALQQQIEALGIRICADDYQRELLQRF